MAIQASAMPLIALDAVIIDTETTGLDPAHARLVEVAAVRLAGGLLDEAGALRWLVQPGEPIPAQATAVHGINAATLATAPTFAAVWPELKGFLAKQIIIGHALGFDLAILKSECARAGITWPAPRTLDTLLLAEIVLPNLAGYSLDQLAAWLDVGAENRHSALGDALIAGRIFIALVPKLREIGIRTLAEAERACRALTDLLDRQHRAGWAEAIASPASLDRSLLRLDSLPFRHRVADIMSPPQFTPPQAPVAEAMQRMARARISSLFVAAPSTDTVLRPETTGIATERDILRAIAEHGGGALALPIGEFASSPLFTIAADSFVYRAIGHMRRLKVRHLGVVDENNRLCGVVSARDLLRLRAEEAIWLGEEIDEADSVPELARAWPKLPLIAEALLGDAVAGRDVAAVISHELGALTRRACELAERRMRADGLGTPPCPYAFAVLGSAGRGESLLALDQDNALVFAQGTPGSAEDRWFETLATHVADILHDVGVPYCKGGVMAKNPQWRGSMATWRDRAGNWIKRSDPQDLLSVDIFFDLRGAHGDLELAATLRREAYDAAAGETAFAKLLAEAAGSTDHGIGWFGRFRTEQGRIDLKRTGLFGIVTAARVLAIQHHILERSTLARLAALSALDIGAAQDLEALAEAHGVFMDLILRQQIDDVAHGIPPTTAVTVRNLSSHQRERLRAALLAVRSVDEMTRDLLFEA